MTDGGYRDPSDRQDDFTAQNNPAPTPYSKLPPLPGSDAGAASSPFDAPTGVTSTGGFAAQQPTTVTPAYQAPQYQAPQHQSGAYGAAAPTAPYGAPSTTPYQQPYGTGQFAAASPSGPPTGSLPPIGSDPAPGGGSGRGGSGKKLLVGAAVVAVLAGGVGGGVGYLVSDRNGTSSNADTSIATGPTQTAQPPAAPGSVQETAARVLPSVVSITVSNGREVGSGSGVVLSDDGTILTNNHVVGGPNMQVLVSFSDGSRARARVLGADPVSDVAVIKADKIGLTPITIGKSDNLTVGQNVIAIGSPLGLEGTVTTGIISALNRPVSTSGADGQDSVIDAIQTDAAINPGNSGGALINSAGALIGINTAIATLGASTGSESGSIGLGFAIPVDQAMRVANQLRTSGKATQANIGVSVRPAADLEKPGAVVANVVRGGPAERAGIPVGALITAVNDRHITSADSLVAAVRSNAPADTVKVTYTVNGDSKTVDVTLGTL
ncbi:S1C family serine protease [Gordonia malaquae]|uniref:S1C family serine protease n=1 Tax=Gordonia malaquae TaxID=410332 RepID=UPI003018AC08